MPTIKFDRLVWDDWNLRHITKHDITVEEIEAVLAGYVFGRETYKNRYQVLGPVQQGKILSIIVGAVPDRINTWYVFSARPASRRERKRYELQKGGSTT